MEKNQDSLYDTLDLCCRKWQIDTKTSRSMKASADFIFPASFVGFAGHFPGQPILPAIVQMAAVRYLSERALGTCLLPVHYGKTKFRGLVQPDEMVLVMVELEKKQGCWSGSFKIRKMDKKLVTIGLVKFSF